MSSTAPSPQAAQEAIAELLKFWDTDGVLCDLQKIWPDVVRACRAVEEPGSDKTLWRADHQSLGDPSELLRNARQILQRLSDETADGRRLWLDPAQRTLVRAVFVDPSLDMNARYSALAVLKKVASAKAGPEEPSPELISKAGELQKRLKALQSPAVAHLRITTDYYGSFVRQSEPPAPPSAAAEAEPPRRWTLRNLLPGGQNPGRVS